MVTARAVTDEAGRTISGWGGDCFRASKVSINSTRQYDHMPAKPVVYKETIDVLLRGRYLGGAYNLLMAYLVDKLKIPYYKIVQHGRTGRVVWIEVDDKTYWACGHTIHDRY